MLYFFEIMPKNNKTKQKQSETKQNKKQTNKQTKNVAFLSLDRYPNCEEDLSKASFHLKKVHSYCHIFYLIWIDNSTNSPSICPMVPELATSISRKCAISIQCTNIWKLWSSTLGALSKVVQDVPPSRLPSQAKFELWRLTFSSPFPPSEIPLPFFEKILHFKTNFWQLLAKF